MSQKPAVEYYYLDALNNGHGPLSLDKMRALLRKTNLQVWRAGLGDWTLGSALPEFARAHAPEVDPSLAAMLDLCHGILDDGVVTEDEAQTLRTWLAAHGHLTTHWPGDALAARLREIYADGVVSAPERAELKTLLDHVVANPPTPKAVVKAHADDVFDQPPPHVSFRDKRFCFAGLFVYGTLERCHQIVVLRGGQAQFEPQWDTHYLVVGAVEPGQRQIAQAQKLKQLGGACKIIAEEHWTARLLTR